MRWALDPHPTTSRGSVESLEVGIIREGDALSLVYVLSGDIEQLRIPDAAEPRRRDGLWQRTCFEAFVRRIGEEAYCEFNLSPSSEWAAYRFTGYRDGMRALPLATEPEIAAESDGRRLKLWSRLELGDIDALAGQDWAISLSAIIAQRNGDKSYWALDHAAGAPDFHHPDCFALELPAAEPE